MASMNGIIKAMATLAIIGFALFLVLRVSDTAPENPRHVRWLIGHKPTEVFDASIQFFADELAKETNGRLVLDVILPEELGYENDIPHADIMRYLSEGEIELATTYTAALGATEKKLWMVMLPFLVPDYDGVELLLDGPVGERVLASVEDATDVRALAFTMSGGLRIIASSKPIDSPSDFKNMRIAVSAGPVAEAALRALGAVPVPTNLEAETPNLTNIDAVETAYSRLFSILGRESAYTKHIAETYHSIFLTTILASDSFYDSLSPGDQSALRRIARDAARIERADSIAFGLQTKETLKSEGTVVKEFTAEERAEMEEATRPVYEEFRAIIGADVLEALGQ